MGPARTTAPQPGSSPAVAPVVEPICTTVMATMPSVALAAITAIPISVCIAFGPLG